MHCTSVCSLARSHNTHTHMFVKCSQTHIPVTHTQTRPHERALAHTRAHISITMTFGYDALRAGGNEGCFWGGGDARLKSYTRRQENPLQMPRAPVVRCTCANVASCESLVYMVFRPTRADERWFVVCVCVRSRCILFTM